MIQRGNNRGATFICEDDYAQYRGWLAEAGELYRCRILADVFMTNHVHLLVTPEREDILPRAMQSSGRGATYATSMQRTAELARFGRDATAPIDSEAYFLACCRYVELNPVRTGMVRHPRDWSRQGLLSCERRPLDVMPGLVPGTHVLAAR